MTDEEFIRRFPTMDDYLAHHRQAHHCCGCVNQDPPLPCCNPGHPFGEHSSNPREDG